MHSAARRSFDDRVSSTPWFAQNFSEGYLREPALNGVVALPASDVCEPIVDVDDIAVAALTEDRHAGQLYEVKGPRLQSFAEAATEQSGAMARQVRYQPIAFDAFHSSMMALGGAVVADVFTEICREVLDGRNTSLGDGVRRALGREPRDFGDFCGAAAAAGAWEHAG